MSQVTLDTNTVWDIGKIAESVQKSTISLADNLRATVKSLTSLEDFSQLYDEKIEKELRKMESQAHRCGMTASYIFKIAENYEDADKILFSYITDLFPALNDARVLNDKDCTEAGLYKTQTEINTENFLHDPLFKNGAIWTVGKTPELTNAKRTGCCAFAGDYIKYVYNADLFGDGKTFSRVNDISGGDVLHITGHWLVVISRDGDKLHTIEGNWGGRVRESETAYTIRNGALYRGKERCNLEAGYHFE